MYKTNDVFYGVVNKTTLKCAVFKEKSQVCDYLGLSKMSFYRNFRHGQWDTGDYMVTFVEKIQLKSARGDHSGRNLGEWKK